MKQLLLILLFLAWAGPATGKAPQEASEKERVFVPSPSPNELSGVIDRAGCLLNKSNIGHYYENRGKLYPRRDADGPDGVWPIGSNRKYIYRINPYIGVPGNVVQGRWQTNEEWEAVGGYHNPDSAKCAASDRSYTWPSTGWPIRDADGNPVFKSDQDTYCVYSDSTNTRARLGLFVAQTSYGYSAKLARDMIFFKFEVTNNGSSRLDGLYFCMYVDMDIGNVPGNIPEYTDDVIGWDKPHQLLYFADTEGIPGTEWTGGPPGLMGVAFLKTPAVNGKELGVTDMHYVLNDNEVDVDSIHYGIMSSATYLYNSPDRDRFFHLGANFPDLHYDDPATQPSTGLDLLAMMSSGPYTLEVGDTLTFHTVLVAGNALPEILKNTESAMSIMADFDYELSRPPERPRLTAIPGDRRVTLYWDNRAEQSVDKLSNQRDFEGYRLYRSLNQGATWDQIDRNGSPSVGPDPVPIATFDKVNGIGKDVGLQYSYVDSSLIDGVEYWYSITAYDRGDSTTESLESARGSSLEEHNIVSVVPRQNAVGRTPGLSGSATQTGTGSSNYEITVVPTDRAENTGRTYSIEFAPVATIEKGNPSSVITSSIVALDSVTGKDYVFQFISPTAFRILDAADQSVLLDNVPYTSGTPVRIGGVSVVISDPDTSELPDFLPQAGDEILVGRGVRITSGSDTVLSLRRLVFGTTYATSNGVLVGVRPSNYVKRVTLVSGKGLSLSTAAQIPDSVVADLYTLRVTGVTPGDTAKIDIEIRSAAGNVLVAAYGLSPGTQLAFRGIRVTLNFSSTVPPLNGTTYEIETLIPKTITYRDKFSFSVSRPAVSADDVKSGLSRVRVVPNPYVMGSLYEPEYGELRREPVRQIRFTNLPPVCTIHIFTLDGDVVKTIEHADGSGAEPWDLRTSAGREIAPGIFFYLVKTESGERLDRFAVIK